MVVPFWWWCSGGGVLVLVSPCWYSGRGVFVVIVAADVLVLVFWGWCFPEGLFFLILVVLSWWCFGAYVSCWRCFGCGVPGAVVLAVVFSWGLWRLAAVLVST